MTIEELYEFAKEKDILNYEIQIQHGDDGGYYPGTRDVEMNIVIEDEIVLL